MPLIPFQEIRVKRVIYKDLTLPRKETRHLLIAKNIPLTKISHHFYRRGSCFTYALQTLCMFNKHIHTKLQYIHMYLSALKDSFIRVEIQMVTCAVFCFSPSALDGYGGDGVARASRSLFSKLHAIEALKRGAKLRHELSIQIRITLEAPCRQIPAKEPQ
jgi:hypothetical protein